MYPPRRSRDSTPFEGDTRHETLTFGSEKEGWRNRHRGLGWTTPDLGPSPLRRLPGTLPKRDNGVSVTRYTRWDRVFPVVPSWTGGTRDPCFQGGQPQIWVTGRGVVDDETLRGLGAVLSVTGIVTRPSMTSRVLPTSKPGLEGLGVRHITTSPVPHHVGNDQNLQTRVK